MPLISIRMSASSSTMRISAAMRPRQCRLSQLGLRRLIRTRVPECHPHDRAAAGAIVQLQQRTVILDDLLHDGQPEAGAAGARRDIWLREPLAPLIGQATA